MVLLLRHQSVPEHGLMSCVNNSVTTTEVYKVMKQILVFGFKLWKDLQLLPQLNAAIAKLTLGLAKSRLIGFGSNSRTEGQTMFL